MGMSDFDNISDKPEWYVVHTMTGYEKKVRTSLEQMIAANEDLAQKIMEINIPMITLKRKDRQGKEVEVEKPRYPSYVYIKMIMSGDTWHKVRYINGVTSFVGNGARPIPLTQEEIEKLGFKAPPEMGLAFKLKDYVTIKAGPFMGQSGYVTEISEDQKKVKVLITMFGREMPLEIDSDSVAPFGV
ncbi:MAG: transcription termination/antitermination protein NusG [Firmicutes bacterium]|nr:transcription termination/antitermination protein NusG [Candidatus Colimorpha enterica]